MRKICTLQQREWPNARAERQDDSITMYFVLKQIVSKTTKQATVGRLVKVTLVRF